MIENWIGWYCWSAKTNGKRVSGMKHKRLCPPPTILLYVQSATMPCFTNWEIEKLGSRLGFRTFHRSDISRSLCLQIDPLPQIDNLSSRSWPAAMSCCARSVHNRYNPRNVSYTYHANQTGPIRQRFFREALRATTRRHAAPRPDRQINISWDVPWDLSIPSCHNSLHLLVFLLRLFFIRQCAASMTINSFNVDHSEAIPYRKRNNCRGK